MNTAEQIADAIGRKVLAQRFKASPQLVWHHVNKGQFPASWYTGCCELAGVDELPTELFTFKKLVVADDESEGVPA